MGGIWDFWGYMGLGEAQPMGLEKGMGGWQGAYRVHRGLG